MPAEYSSYANSPQSQVGGFASWGVGGLSLCLVGGSFVMDNANLRAGFLAAAVVMLVLYLLVALSRVLAAPARRINAPLDAINALISQDLTASFLADAQGDVQFANKAAHDRCSVETGQHLSSILGRLVAAPDALLYRLQGRCAADGAAKEDVATRNGQFRLSVVKVGGDLFLWRLDDTGQAARHLGRAADALSLPMITLGSQDAILYVNEAFRALLGSRPRSLVDVFGPDPLHCGQIRDLQTENGPVSVLVATVNGAGAGRKEVYVLPAPEQTSDNLNIAEPLQTEWKAIEDLPVPLLKIGPDGMITASNRQARKLLGLEADAKFRARDVFDGPGRPISDWIDEILNGRTAQDSQFLRGRANVRDKFIQVTLRRAGLDDDVHLIAVLNDVTELKTLEEQFGQSQKMQAIGQLAGGVAHDFNNLLTAISGHCDLLLLRHDQADQNYSDLIQIHQNANRAASLVGQLLAFSRKQTLQPVPINMQESLSDLTHLLNRLVGEKVTLTLDHDAELEGIMADKRQIEQVMMNLVVNARDAMPEGGEVVIRTTNCHLYSPLEEDHVKVPPGDYVSVKVIDEGEGIAHEKLPKIFEPFFTTKPHGEGTGLGLSTVYGIVKQSGGYIFARSELGNGAEFEILFPAQKLQPVVEVEIPKLTVTQRTGEGAVLLVEDEAPVRAFASRALQMRGYSVLEANSGETALALLRDPELHIDLFLSDVIMPGIDGPTWVKQALADRPNTKVVFMSGYAEDAFGDDGTGVDQAIFLPKPFSLAELTQVVQGQLSGS